MPTLYIGLISGTSMDAVDAVLADLDSRPPRMLAALSQPIPDELKLRLRAAAAPELRGGLDEFGALDCEVAELFSGAVMQLLGQAGIPSDRIEAIGSHGQTLLHRPDAPHPFTLQIGDPSRIAERTGITVVADFRRRDIAAGGQGAPLVPAFHAYVFGDGDKSQAILNLGGIANLTLIPKDGDGKITGFDVGPANTLMDHWAQRHFGTAYDEGGRWAAGGRTNERLLKAMLADPYFGRSPPKSTGPEHFGPSWLDTLLDGFPGAAAQDVQRTLVELTARSVAEAIARHACGTRVLYVCGGGVHNGLLMTRLAACLPGCQVASTAEAGIDPDHMEALAFAWLASRTLAGLPGNLPAVTGASHPVVLGAIYPGGCGRRT